MRAAIKTKMTTKTVTKYRLEITGSQLVEILRRHGYDIPEEVTPEFHVPGGANWSNTSIDIDEENPIYIDWKTETDSVVEG